MVTNSLRNVHGMSSGHTDEYERLQGIDTEFADWHAKYTLHKVIRALRH